MSKLFFVYSTLSASVAYTNYDQGGGDLPIPQEPVEIKGGANIAGAHLLTPHGVVTSVTEAQLEYLKRNPVFQQHEKNGFIRVEAQSRDAEKAAADMEGRDKSAPLVPQDMKPQDAAPVAGGRKKRGS